MSTIRRRRSSRLRGHVSTYMTRGQGDNQPFIRLLFTTPRRYDVGHPAKRPEQKFDPDHSSHPLSLSMITIC